MSLCGLKDMQKIGARYIWTNKQQGLTRVYSTIDRSLVNDDWILRYPCAFTHYMPEMRYDHCPGVIRFTEQQNQKPKSFKKFNMWCSHPSYSAIIDA